MAHFDDQARGIVAHGTAHRRGFTLIEVLVVIAITVVLISILVPSLNNARRYAVQVKCSSNMRQIGIGNGTYMADFKEWLLGMSDPKTVRPIAADLGLANNATKEQWGVYWPTTIRWCPDMATDRDLIDGGAGGWAPGYGTRDNASQNLRTNFGYTMPALSEFTLDGYGYHATRRLGAAENNLYVRPEYEGQAQSYSSGVRTYDGGKSWRFQGTLPYAFDMIWYNSSSPPTQFIIAHDTDGDPLDGLFRVRPAGGNGLWGDGSAKWYPYVQTSATQGEYRDVAVGAVVGSSAKLREDWCRMYSSLNWFFVAKRGR
jgi:prepilin-type N-terminal cleavage/methylation domain-containing protein